MASANVTPNYLTVDSTRFSPQMAEAVLQFDISDELRKQVFDLGEKARLGTITDEQRTQLLRLIEQDEMMALMKAEAKAYLAKQA